MLNKTNIINRCEICGEDFKHLLEINPKNDISWECNTEDGLSVNNVQNQYLFK